MKELATDLNRSDIRIGVVSTFCKNTNGETFLVNLLELQSQMVKEQHVIAPTPTLDNPSNIFLYSVDYRIGTNFLSQIWHQAVAQLQMSYKLIRISNKVDYWLFFGGDLLLLPMLCAKMKKKKVLSLLGGNLASEIALKKHILNVPQKILRRMCLRLTDYIAVYSEILIDKWDLGRYSDKIVAADNHHVDCNMFKISKPFSQRERKIGYIGRLSAEKGIANLLQCLPTILSKYNDLKFSITGDGPMEDQVRTFIDNHNFGDRLVYFGRVSHDKIANILNDLQLCVLPSYTEGLPNIMLESMGCGTPVLATPVGAIPDVITDNENGFIIQDNCPETIVNGIIRALESPNIFHISELAHRTATDSYNIGCARDRYSKVIATLESSALKMTSTRGKRSRVNSTGS